MSWYRIDKGDGSRTQVTEERVREVVKMNYRDAENIISNVREGKYDVQSPFAIYRWEGEVKGGQ